MQIERIHISDGDAKGQIQQMRTYLFKLAEQLEDTLSHIEDQLVSIRNILEKKGE